MNGMLEHQEFWHQEIKRHQQEARGWARTGSLGRLAASARLQSHEHPGRSRFVAIASPMAVALGLLAILI